MNVSGPSGFMGELKWTCVEFGMSIKWTVPKTHEHTLFRKRTNKIWESRLPTVTNLARRVRRAENIIHLFGTIPEGKEGVRFRDQRWELHENIQDRYGCRTIVTYHHKWPPTVSVCRHSFSWVNESMILLRETSPSVGKRGNQNSPRSQQNHHSFFSQELLGQSSRCCALSSNQW